MEKFDSAFSYILIYVFAIYDQKHSGCLKVGKASLKLDDPTQYSSLHTPYSSLLNKAAKIRIDDCTKTAGIGYDLRYTELAERKVVTSKNTMELRYFTDKKVHDVLKNSGIENVRFENSREWYRTDLDTVKKAITAVKEGRTSLSADQVSTDHSPIDFRPEQLDAIEMTLKRFRTHHNKILWNAKMRFGKTLCSFEVVKELQCKKTIILTHRPVVDDEWQREFPKIFWNSKYYYCPKGTSEKDVMEHVERNEPFIYFASIQDLRGSETVGGKFDKNSIIFKLNWDLMIVDEAHEGTKTSLGDEVLQEIIKEKSYGETKQLYLSGTPFNLVDDFDEDDVYTWDYVMEQKAKSEWDVSHFLDSNPYDDLPKLNIFTYDIADAIPGYEDIEDKAFNFHEFFRVWTGSVQVDGRLIPEDSAPGRFVHEKDVISFIRLLRIKDASSNYPFSREEYRDYFRHTLWMLPGVKEAAAMEVLLQEDEVFGNFTVVNVAGDSPSGEKADALQRLNAAITENPEDTSTITLSCGRLTTGVTVKPWTAVLMLSGSTTTAASMYLQTIFRVQSPANINGKMKASCYVFDFAPDRTLQMVAEAGKLGTRPGRSSDEARMSEFLNFCPVIAIKGSEMRSYDVNSMLRQLKRYYAARVVQNGFDDVKLYNEQLLKLTDVDKKKFEELKKIVGESKAIKSPKKIVISESGLGPEEQEEAEEAEKKKRKKQILSAEEKEALRKLKEAREAKSKAVSILRAISIRIPLLVYGAEKHIDENITIDHFAELIDDASWNEFMPTGVTKAKFNQFIGYYDKDIFIEAGNQIRKKVKAADELNPTERVQKLGQIFATFKNPDKETVLTPWRAVNMHMTDCLGGYDFFDEKHKDLLDNPRFVDQGTVTNNTVANTNAKILEINSKSGLYPLFVAYSIYRTKLSKFKPEQMTLELQNQLWNSTLNENVFVICKTKMAKQITKRTLLGYKDGKIHSHHFDDLINQFRCKSGQVTKKIGSCSYWDIQGGDMKFDAIVGNPPYQDTNGSGGSNDAPIYQFFVQASRNLSPDYISMVIPSRWFSGGREGLLDDFRKNMLNNNQVKKLFAYPNSTDVFTSVDIKGGVCYFLIDKNYHETDCEYSLIENGKVSRVNRKLNEFEILIRNPNVARVVKTVWEHPINGSVASMVSGDTPFGIPTNPATSVKHAYDISDEMDIFHPTSVLYLENHKRKVAYLERALILKNAQDIDKYKVFIPKASGSGNDPYVVGKPEFGSKDSVCSQTFLYVPFDTEKEAINFMSYISTKFFRVMVSASKISQDLPAKYYRFVPIVDFNKPWTDPELYSMFGLSKDEIDIVENLIAPFDSKTMSE